VSSSEIPIISQMYITQGNNNSQAKLSTMNKHGQTHSQKKMLIDANVGFAL